MLWFGTVVAAWFYSTLPWHVCSFSGGSYQQHLGMLEQWIDSNGHAAQHVGKQNGRRKGAKTAGTSLLAFNISLSLLHGLTQFVNAVLHRFCAVMRVLLYNSLFRSKASETLNLYTISCCPQSSLNMPSKVKQCIHRTALHLIIKQQRCHLVLTYNNTTLQDILSTGGYCTSG